MPSKSKAQHNLMAMVAHDPKAAKRMGIPQSVGRDYVTADKGKKFESGGNVKKEMKAAKIFAKAGEKKLAAHERREAEGKEKDTPAIAKKEMAVLKKSKAPKDVMEYESAEHEEMGMKKGGKVKKMAFGGSTIGNIKDAWRRFTNPTPQETQLAERAFQDRVNARMAPGYNPANDPSGIRYQGLVPTFTSPVQSRPVTPAPSGPMTRRGKREGGKIEAKARGGGIESKGKTRGTMVKMARGGGIEIRGKTRGKFV